MIKADLLLDPQHLADAAVDRIPTTRTLVRMLACVATASALSACGWVVSSPDGATADAPAASTSDAVPNAGSTPTGAVETAAMDRPTDLTASRPSATPAANATPAGNAPATTPTTPTAPVATAPATTPAARPASSTVNTLDTIVGDMRLMNDFPLRGYENRTVGWYVGPGYTYLGNDPRMTNAPQWFKDSYPQYVNGNYMRAILPWLVMFDGTGHASSNSRVHVRNMRAYYLSRSTNQWRSFGMSPGVSGYATPKSTLVGGSIPEDKRTNGDGSVEVKPPSDTNFAWHGWWNAGIVTIDPTDIAAVFVTLHARLTVDDPNRADDRARSQMMIQMGADYYVDGSWRWTVGAPGVGTSRSKRVTNDWQAFNLFTFSDVGIQEPGGGITQAAFRANPPPLE